MEASEALNAAIKTVGIPYARALLKVQERKPKPSAYITYQLIYGAGAAHADDGEEAFESLWGIELYSKENYTEAIRKVRHALKTADFYGITVEAEQHEQDTGYYHISFTAKYMNMEV